MDDTLSKHTEAEVGMKPLEDVRDAFGSDLLSLIEGHDADADMRQRNREFVSSGKIQTRRDLWAHLKYHTGAAISPLVLPYPFSPGWSPQYPG
jgi:hypothetical protein